MASMVKWGLSPWEREGTGWERGVFTRGAGGQPWAKEEGLAGPASSRSLVDTPRKQQQ